eukprot:CAMPEP_0181473382 /NCGR_PEP_ID=MMETSP1110-20121109/40093_1 /TAXON_ID=174948 /ORGANISM="Symbiodinium sp., Strain CCMP421" /LENGTH=63 /DNA_ID=CAMNT_0023598493 /DNA_START=78 /DNA_END=269 /DNA_ORIENTATION=+
MASLRIQVSSSASSASKMSAAHTVSRNPKLPSSRCWTKDSNGTSCFAVLAGTSATNMAFSWSP